MMISVLPFKKKNLNYEMNIYKLVYYNYINNKFVSEILELPKNDLSQLKQTITTIGLSLITGYGVILNKAKDVSALTKEECITTFSNLANESEKTSDVKEWLYEFYQKGKIVPPEVKDNGVIGKPFNDYFEQLNFQGFKDFITNFNNFVDGVTKFGENVVWIFKNPIRSLLIVNNYVFELGCVLLLIFFIVSIFASMFTGEKELKKPLKFCKNTVLLTFILSLVLQAFVVSGFN